ncbi:sulfatase-like hydrolase/transferase [Pontiella desulfatans]|nr:sulfatase-like hydrolase/transferase [Pontiella desulfatans]
MKFFVNDNGLKDVAGFEAQAELLSELGYAGICTRPHNRTPEMLKAFDAHGLNVPATYVTLKPSDADVPEQVLKQFQALEGRDTIVWLMLLEPKASDEQAVSIIRKVCDASEKYKLPVVLYPHVGCRTSTIEECVRLIELAERPGLGVSFNLCHFLRQHDNSTIEASIREFAPYIKLVQINGADDVPKTESNWDYLIKPLGEGSLDVGRVIRTLEEIGYNGYVNLQCYRVNPPAAEHLKASMEAWKQYRGKLSITLKAGIDLWKQDHVEYVNGQELRAVVEDKHAPLYLSLDVTDVKFTDGRAPLVEFSFDYFDEGGEELTFDIDSSDPLHGPLEVPGQWRGAGGVQFLDSKTWKTKTIVVTDARFSNRLNGADIRFRMVKQPELRLRNISLKKLDALPADSGPLKQGEVPNILMVVFDDLNDYVGAFGDPNALTPNLDVFAASGMRFNRAYCQYPVCGPSRASFMTGLYPEASGVLDNSKHIRFEQPDAVNMLEYFKEAGYWTASAGKIFHSFQNVAERGISTYASDWFQNAEDPWKKKLEKQFVDEVGPVNEHREAYNVFMNEHFVNPEKYVQAIATDLKDEDHKDGRTATRISSYLKEKPFEGQPFFIACGIAKPHIPYFAPSAYFDLYPLENLMFEDVPSNDWNDKPAIAADAKYKGFGAEFGRNDRVLRAKWLQAYLACVSFADSQFGRILHALEENGHADNTIVIVFGDHGYHIGEHFMYGKVTLFEESARVPFVMRVPGKSDAGVTTESFAELIDVYPTLTELCGLETPEQVQGISLVPILGDPAAAVRDSAYTVVSRPSMLGRAIRHEQWRYAEWGGADKAELYDLEKDPREYNNLAANPEYAEVVQQLSGKLNARKP